MDAGDFAGHACIAANRARNERALINRLPLGLLSDIFLVGRAELPRSGWWDRPFPIRISQVCSQWRRLVIGNPLLWDWIHIDSPPPNPLAALHLSRAGPDVLVDIVLELRIAYWRKAGINPTHWSTHANHLPALFEFLTSNGAHIHRWRSLIINVRTPRAAFEIIRVLNAESAPALRYFSCTWNSGLADQYEEEEPDYLDDLVRRYGTFESFQLSGPRFPSMRSAELAKIPWSFVLERPVNAPLFSGLVSLMLGAASEDADAFNYLPRLFSANPRLEELCLHSGFGLDGNFLESYPHTCQPSSDSKFRFMMGLGFDLPELFAYVATGRTPSESKAELAISRPMFPLLRCLYLHIYPLDKSHEVEALKHLFSAYPLVHHLHIPYDSVDVLGEEPWLLHSLSHLGVLYHTPPQLGNILRKRLEAGLSAIQTVEIDRYGLSEIVGGVPDSTRVIRNAPRPEFVMEYFADDQEDEEEWDV